MDGKDFYEKTEEFAKKIINLAADEGLTVYELCMAADTAKGIAERSTVDKESIGKTDFPSRHIAKENPYMLFTPSDSSGTKYSAESIEIPCPVVDREPCR